MLQHLDTQKSTSPDEISAGFLKEVATEIAEPLTCLYNFSLQSGSIPRDWKQSNVTTVASTKSNFRSAATTWWNSLPSHLHDCNLNLGNFMKAVRNFYMDRSLCIICNVVVSCSILYVLL